MIDGMVSGGAAVSQRLLTPWLWKLWLGGEAGCREENGVCGESLFLL